MKLNILSWNIWGGKYLEEVVNFLRTANADIIALQEVIKEENSNTAIAIAAELGYEPVYALEMQMSSKWAGPPRKKEEIIKFGNAVLSKHAISNSTAHELSADERRVAVQADIRMNDAVIHIFSIHLKHDHPQKSDPVALTLQNKQADSLARVLPPEKAIVVGDFNAIPGSYAINRISSALSDAEKNSRTPTWSVYPDGCDICRPQGVQYKLDYIFTSRDLTAQSFKVHNSNGSDHLPVSAIVEI